jgi:hypothetical protein
MDPLELILLRDSRTLRCGIGHCGQLAWSLFQ